MPTPRERAHAEQRDRILAVARAHLVADGAAQLSLRKVITEVGMVSSAIYRYFPTRDALLTALIVQCYGDLAEVLEAVADGDPRRRFTELARTLMAWGQAHPREFALLYGTPVAGYQAPADTIAPAAGVVLPFLAAVAAGVAAGVVEERGPSGGPLTGQAEALAAGVGMELPSGVVLAAVEAFVLVVGALILQLGGHFVGTFDPFDPLAERLVATAVGTAGFTPVEPGRGDPGFFLD